MRLVLICLILVLLSAQAVFAQPSSPMLFDFKGSVPGMQLESWKLRPYPVDEQDRVSFVESKGEHFSLVYRLKIRNKDRVPVPITIANQPCLDASWSFLPDADGKYKLASINLATSRTSFPILLDALKEKFGMPTKTKFEVGYRACQWSQSPFHVTLVETYNAPDDVCLIRYMNEELLKKFQKRNSYDL